MNEAILVDCLRDRGRRAVLESVRTVLEETRAAFQKGELPAVDPPSVAIRARARLEAEKPSLRPVINATGVLLHTGLGRSPLAEEAVTRAVEIARGYSSLEYDLEHHARGRRTQGIARLLCRLTGAEAATAVNNNAAATVLALRALAAGREVVVSRGQLVEIGGGFRLPEIFEVAGVTLREVGTTNKTRLADYARVIGPATAAILRVHRANFEIVGFTEDVPLADLVKLAHDHGLWVIDDIGSGALGPGRPPWDGDEPTACQAILDQADLVLFSGDKLLGGPQCGIMVGISRAITLVESDPMMRAMRLDKMTLAALEATLEIILDVDHAAQRIPLWAMIKTPVAQLELRAQTLADAINAQNGPSARVVVDHSRIGGGSAPGRVIETRALALSPPFPAAHPSPGAFSDALARADPPVVARVHQDQVLLDPRTIPPALDQRLLDAILSVCHHQPSENRAIEPDRDGTPRSKRPDHETDPVSSS